MLNQHLWVHFSKSSLLKNSTSEAQNPSKDTSIPTVIAVLAMASLFRDYCSSTSLHGWQYVSAERNKLAKLFWVLVVLASISAAVFFVNLNIQVLHLLQPVVIVFVKVSLLALIGALYIRHFLCLYVCLYVCLSVMPSEF